LKAVREKKQVSFTGKPMKITADFTAETLKERSTWSEVYWSLNENNFSPRILYQAKLSFKLDRGIKVFHNKQKLKKIITINSSLQKILQGVLHTEDKSNQNH
jgi:hypothetical protein